jgi:hypothetical protein
MLPHNCFYLDADSAGTAEDRLYGFALLDDGIVVGTGGIAAWRQAHPGERFRPRDGRFACVLREDAADGGPDATLRILTDVTGQESLYVFVEPDFWAVSSSFALLVARLSRRRRIALYAPAAVAFHIKNGVHLGEQLTSFRTLAEGVTILPATSTLEVDLRTNRARIVDQDLLEAFGTGGRSYEEILLNFLERMLGALAALRAIVPAILCELSGGYDSRVALALLLASRCDGERPGQIWAKSYLGQADDLRAATVLCEALSVPLNTGHPLFQTLSAAEALRVWDLSCLGVYLPFHPAHNLFASRGMHLSITGDTALSWSYFEGPGLLNGPAPRIAEGMRRMLGRRPHVDVILADHIAAFDRAGIDRDAPYAMEAFYGLFRSRAHGGRHWYKELGHTRRFTPLCDSAMATLDILSAVRGWDRRKVYCDLLLATEPRLLRLPFESPAKGFDEPLIAASPFRKLPRIVPRPMSVWGSWDPPEPEPELILPFLPLGREPEDFVRALKSRLGGVDRAALGEIFTNEDFARADAELAAPASLSHGTRSVAHVISVAAVAEMAAASTTRSGAT